MNTEDFKTEPPALPAGEPVVPALHAELAKGADFARSLPASGRTSRPRIRSWTIRRLRRRKAQSSRWLPSLRRRLGLRQPRPLRR